MSVSQDVFENAYRTSSPPWVIDEPQPVVLELERAGEIRGAVLDAGAGAGEHTIHLAAAGYDVLGIDFAPAAVALARARAAERGVAARFETVDALALGGEPRFDTVVDSALFHVFDAGDQRRYAAALHGVCRPRARVHVLALSDREEGFGPRISDGAIRAAFTGGWEIERLQPSRYRGVADEQAAAELGVEPGVVDALAWLATARRR